MSSAAISSAAISSAAISSAAISSSEDELRVIHDNEKQQPSTPRPKTKKKPLQDPTYILQEDEPEPGTRKRKSQTEDDEVSLLEYNGSPPSKKPNTKMPSISVASEATSAGTTENHANRNNYVQPYVESSGASSIASEPSLFLRSSHPTRRRSALYEEDTNYVAESDDEEDKEADEYAIPDNEKATVLFDFDREREKRLASVIDIPEGLYTEKEKSLFLKLAMRGFEPLAPKDWQFDFPTLPDSLFPESGKQQSDPIIKISRSTAFYAIKSLANLFSLSGRVRDCSIVEKRPEALIKQTIRKYIRWALYDVNLEISPESIPIHAIHAQREKETVRQALERLNKRLKKLAVRHRTALEAASEEQCITTEMKQIEAPLLIGFLICGPVVALMTYDLDLAKDDEDVDGKFFSQFDFAERGQDLWNSLSIAIVVMHIRNTMVRLTENSYGGFVKSPRSSAVSEDL